MSAVEIKNLSHSYGKRIAVNNVSLTVEEGEIFGLLGPNGGGKTTLFRILSTLFPLSSGTVQLFGLDLKEKVQEVRKILGVIFQSPSLDKKLTVRENLTHQGHLYGLSGNQLAERSRDMLTRVGLTDRTNDIVEKLSGGLQRRVEVAKALLHKPKLLLLDEPTTGLDPGARKDLWDYLKDLRTKEGMTVLFTTHLMEEAERCDRLGILDQGQLIALDTPDALRSKMGAEVIIARTRDPNKLAKQVEEKFGDKVRVLEDTIRFERSEGHQFVTRLIEAFPGQIDAVTVGRPTLEDVFIQLTGHQFWASKNETEKMK